MSKTTTRVSKKVEKNYSQEQFAEAMAAYATASAQGKKLMAGMEKDIVKVRENYAERLNEVADQKVANMEIIETYCLENKQVLFNNTRSMVTLHGTVGFRLGTPMLKLLPKVKWDVVLERLRNTMPEFIRRKEEVDKEGILHSRHDDKVAPRLNEIGVYVDQDERFFLELNEETEPEK